MKATPHDPDRREPLPEYDLAELLPGGVQGKYAARYREGTNIVLREPAAAPTLPPNVQQTDLLRDCRPFLALIEAGCGLLLRGEAPGRAPLFRADVRRDRRPRTMPPELHAAADEWFSRQFGVRYRGAALFCTGDPARAARFGRPYAVFPVEGFQFCWSPAVPDLYDWALAAGLVVPAAPGAPARARCTPAEFATALQSLDYRDADLAAAVAAGVEVMLVCRAYYGVDVAGTAGQGLAARFGAAAGKPDGLPLQTGAQYNPKAP